MARSKSDTDTDVAALRSQLAEAQAERDNFRTQYQTASGRIREAELARMTSDERALVADQESSAGKIESMENELSTMEAEIARLADEPGHGAEIAKLNRAMSTTSAKLETETNRKTWLDGQREKFTKQAEARTKGAEVDPTDEKLPNGAPMSAFSPKVQAFINSNPRLKTDAAYFKKAVAAATYAVDAEGIKDQSPEYFAYIEEKLGIRAAEQAEDDDEEQDDEGEEVETQEIRQAHEQGRPVTKQAAAAGSGSIAPVIRQTPTGFGGSNRRAPTLTAEEKEVALSLYAHIPGISDADKLKRYADGRRYMKERSNQHFGDN